MLSNNFHLKIPQNVTKFYMSTLNIHMETLCRLLLELKSSELVLFPIEQIQMFPTYYIFTIQN